MINGEINNVIAGWIWLGTGIIGTTLLNRMGTQTRSQVGGWWKYFFGDEPGDEARGKVVLFQQRMWGFIAGWAALYFLFDWLF